MAATSPPPQTGRAAIADAIRERFAGQAFIPNRLGPTDLSAAHDKAVLVFALTGQALADPAARARAA